MEKVYSRIEQIEIGTYEINLANQNIFRILYITTTK
jgi:hypothetical protein